MAAVRKAKRKDRPVKAASDNAGARLSMMRRFVTKPCANPECGEDFEGLQVTLYCSDECRFRAGYLRKIEAEAAAS